MSAVPPVGAACLYAVMPSSVCTGMLPPSLPLGLACLLHCSAAHLHGWDTLHPSPLFAISVSRVLVSCRTCVRFVLLHPYDYS